jgi:hypothetical protein
VSEAGIVVVHGSPLSPSAVRLVRYPPRLVSYFSRLPWHRVVIVSDTQEPTEEQRVVIEHVHVYQGGQAIVGAVTHAGTPGVLSENQERPHASTAMRSQNQVGEAMSVASGDGTQALPNARRSARVRGTSRAA